MVPPRGFKPRTYWLRVIRSTNLSSSQSWFVPCSMVKSNLSESVWLVFKLNALESKKLISGHSSVVERLVANEKDEGSTLFARSTFSVEHHSATQSDHTHNKPRTTIPKSFFILHDTSELMQSLCMYKCWFRWKIFEIFFIMNLKSLTVQT